MLTITVYRILHDGTRERVVSKATFEPGDPERLAPPLSFPPCRCHRCLTEPDPPADPATTTGTAGAADPAGATGPPGPAVIDADG